MIDQKISEISEPDISAVSQKKPEGKHAISGSELSVMLGLLMLICFIVFHKFILGFAVYLFKDMGSDTLNYSYPAFINIAETIRSGALPGWSFEQGMGQNVFPFSLNDPATYLLYLLGGDNLAFGIVWVEVFKIVCSGLLFFGFLKKLNLDANAAYIGGLLYAFSGFMIVGSGWYLFSTIGLYAALLLLSFEMLYSEKKWWLFPISVALFAAFNFVNLYICSVFLLLYLIFRVLSEETMNLRKLPVIGMNMLLLGTLGVLISSVFSLPNLFQMIDSPRVSGDASFMNQLASLPVFARGDTNYLTTLVMRTFSSDMVGNGSAYKGWGNYMEAPLSYCGLISLLLMSHVFVFLKTRQKIVYGSFIGIFILAEIFPWFRRGVWLFQGDYFRDFSLYVSIVFILFAVLALDKIIKSGKVNVYLLCFNFIVLMIFLYFPYDFNYPNRLGQPQKLEQVLNRGIQAEVAVFLVLITASLILFSSGKFRRYAQLLLLAVTFLELASFTYGSVNKRVVVTADELNKKIGYNDYSIESIAFIKQQDADFFRMEKNYGSSPAINSSLNDSKVQHYFGSSSYHSFNQPNYIKFLSSCNVLNQASVNDARWVVGVRGLPILQVLTGVRYLLFRGDWSLKPALAGIYFEIGKFGDVSVLKSKYALPLGVAYDTYMVQSDFDRLDTDRKHAALLKAIIVPDDLAPNLAELTRISDGDVGQYSLEELAMDTDKLKANSFRIGSFSNNAIDGEISTNSKKLVFFSIPFDSGWSAKVNGEDVEILLVDGGLSAVLIQPGDNVLSLRYSPPFVKYGLYLTLLGLFIFGAALFGNAWQQNNLRKAIQNMSTQ